MLNLAELSLIVAPVITYPLIKQQFYRLSIFLKSILFLCVTDDMLSAVTMASGAQLQSHATL